METHFRWVTVSFPFGLLICRFIDISYNLASYGFETQNINLKELTKQSSFYMHKSCQYMNLHGARRQEQISSKTSEDRYMAKTSIILDLHLCQCFIFNSIL